MKFNVRDEPDTLCVTCKSGKFRKTKDNKITIKCWTFDAYVKEEVVECNQYDHKNNADVQDMIQIAWVIDTNKPGKIGFTQYKDLPDDEKRDLHFL